MPYTYRAATTQGNASGGALTVNKPTGTVDGDLIIVIAYLESDTNSWSSVGSGFTQIALSPDANTGLFSLRAWWKRASGEGASWTWTPSATNWRTVVAATYTGNSGTNSQVDVFGSAQADGVISPQSPSVTTTAGNDLLTAIHGNFQGAANTSLSGAATTERADFGGVVLADALSVAQGATGATTFSVGTVDHVTAHIAFLLDSGGAAASPRLNARHSTLIRM